MQAFGIESITKMAVEPDLRSQVMEFRREAMYLERQGFRNCDPTGEAISMRGAKTIAMLLSVFRQCIAGKLNEA